MVGLKTNASSHRPDGIKSGTTQRDIRVSSEGQSYPPDGPSAPTRIAVWRPISDKVSIKPVDPPTASQQELLDQLQKHVESELVLHEDDPYAKWEKRFLGRPDTYPRYMRASKWNLEEAKTRMKGTLEWRRDYKPDLIPPKEIAEEVKGGKVYVSGFDTTGRPIVWLRPKNENTKPSPTQVRHLIWQLERAIDLMPPGVEKLALVVDYKGATSGNNPPMSTAKDVLNILQNHYVERLGRAVVINVPWYLNAFFAGVKPFLDPATKDKIRFNPAMKELMATEQLDSDFGGEHKYVYDWRVYFPALCQYCGIVYEDGTREDYIPKDHLDDAEAEVQNEPATADQQTEGLVGGASPRRRVTSRPEELQRQLTMTHAEEPADLAEEARKEAERLEEERHFEAQRQSQPDGDSEGLSSIQAGGTVPVIPDSAMHDKVGSQQGADEVARVLGLSGSLAQNGAEMPVPNKAVARDEPDAHIPSPSSSTSPDDTHLSTATAPPASTADASGPAPNATDAATPSAPSAGAELSDAPAVALADAAETAPAVEPPSPAPAPVADASDATPATAQPDAVGSQPVTKVVPNGTAAGAGSTSNGKKRGGWKLFSRKRGLDKAGQPTVHKHKHAVKALCMHKGAVDPSQRAVAPPSAPVEPIPVPAANGKATEKEVLPAEPSKGRVKIASDLPEGRISNAPLMTNATTATFGPEAYQTAREEAGPDGDDYFSDFRQARVEPHKVDERRHKDDHSRLVTRDSEIQHRLHDGGSPELTLAFEVKKPPAAASHENNGDGPQEGAGLAKQNRADRDGSPQ